MPLWDFSSVVSKELDERKKNPFMCSEESLSEESQSWDWARGLRHTKYVLFCLRKIYSPFGDYEHSEGLDSTFRVRILNGFW